MAGEKYKSKYTDNLGNTIPVTAEVLYQVPRFLGGFREAKSGETPTDTLVTIYADMPLKVRLSGPDTTTERLDNSTGEWVPLIHLKYWTDNAREVEKNKQPIPSFGERFLKFIGFKQEGGALLQGVEVKEKVKQLIKLRKDPLKGLQAMQILGEFMQLNPELFETIVLELAQEDLDVAEFVRELQQAAQASAQGTPAAAKGAKLNYVKELKGICPEGYLKTGGRCKPCEAKMKEKGGDIDPVKSFKAGRKCKRK